MVKNNSRSNQISRTKRRLNTPSKRSRSNKNRKQSLSFWLIMIVLIGLAYFFAMSLFVTHHEPQEQASTPTSEEFIAEIAPHAKMIQQRHGILPSIIIGQAILESDWGQSELGRVYFNLFGIKAYGDGEQVTLKTKEYLDDQWIEIDAAFKVYPNWETSMDDHASLFVNGVSWNANLYQDVLRATTYQEAAEALQIAGYATDPSYKEKIINVIEENGLAQYD